MFRTIARPRRASRTRQTLVAITVVATAATVALIAGAAPASAASVSITDASFTWGLTATATGASPVPGSCNFLSAGTAGNTGSSQAWTATTPSPGYAAQSGNVAIEKPDANGVYSAPTFATKCQGPSGTAVSGTASTNSRVKFTGGTGSVDPTTNTATIAWTGSFTSAFYGGLVYWSATNPTLSVAGGVGTLTATLSGYGADMANPGAWVTLQPTTAVIASFTGVTVSGAGFTGTPAYRGVTTTVPTGAGAQATTGADWGSWPQPFIDFQGLTGLTSYWYSSGSGDAGKVALPVTVAYSTPTVPGANPALTVSPTTNIADGTVITVSGTGYDTATPNQQGTGNAGAYVELGWIDAANWKPSAGAPAANRAFTSAVWVHSSTVAPSATQAVLNADGSFSTSVTVNLAALEAKRFAGSTLAIFTVTAGGAPATAGAESFVPLTLAAAAGEQTVTATVVEAPGEFTWTIDSTSHAVTLTNAVNQGAYLESTGSLLPVVVTDTRAGTPQWSVSGQLGDFTGSLSGKYLGWTPKVTTAGAGAVAGDSVAAGITSGNGLKDASVLASATAGHAKGSASLGADLDLRVPVDTAAGTYTATLTLTALS